MKTVVYADREIIRLRTLYYGLAEQFDLETDTVTICGIATSFVYREMFDGQVHMLLPDSFYPLRENEVQLRYLSEDRPQLLLAGESLSENIGFSLISRNGQDLQETIKTMREAILRNFPESVIYESGKINARELEGYWFEYKSFTIDEEAYNLQFLFGSEQLMLLGVFNCGMRYFDEWKLFIQKALDYTELHDGRETI